MLCGCISITRREGETHLKKGHLLRWCLSSSKKKKNKIPIEVRQTLRKIISTVCKFHGERPYRLDKAPESAPPIPPRPPSKRSETLDYLRNSNPHSTIQRALQKPLQNSEDAGARRAELFRRETALEARRQQNLKTRRGNSRLKRVARLRQLASKNEETWCTRKNAGRN